MARRADPETVPLRAGSDAVVTIEIQRVFEANVRVYGARRIWCQLALDGIVVARWTIARLMRRVVSPPPPNPHDRGGSAGDLPGSCRRT